ncbi:SRP40 [Sanghuangporus weigelae]
MKKELLEPGVKEIFKALSEVANNKGRLDAPKDVKKALQEWIEMSDFLDRRDAPLGDIIERWKRIQRSTSSVLSHSIAAFFSPEDSVTIASTLNSEKKGRSTSGRSSSSSSSSSDESNSSEQSESDSDTESDSLSLNKSKAVSSSKSSSSNTISNSDSGTTSSPLGSKSGSENGMPLAKKRKTEGNQSHVGTVQETLKTRKLDEEKVDKRTAVNGGFDATKALGSVDVQPLSPSTPPRSNRRGKEARKSNAPFQRIKTEMVKFADERLKDNSFHSRGSKRGDYGERAHADLIVTRGDGFRKEKNKKKRGSYRGGEITLESHSIKFT